MNQTSAEDMLARVKQEIRADAVSVRQRAGELKIQKPARPTSRVPAPEATRDSYSVAELCQSNFSTFVNQAYSALLRRKPDAAGLDLQLRMLASGRSKIEILGNLRWSAEGRDIDVSVPWLLPRYVFSKILRIPLLGYLIEWLVCLCTLPRLLRHQRATDAYNSARRHELRDQLRIVTQQIEAILVELGRLDTLEARDSEMAATQNQLMDRVGPLEQGVNRIHAGSAELRHVVLSMNHWLASLRENLSALEATESEQARNSDVLYADIAARMLESDQHRLACHELWATRLAEGLPASALVLDLCSGADWLKRLFASGIDAVGVDSNREIGHQARKQRQAIIAATPASVLARTADHSLHGLTALDVGFLLRRIPAAELLAEARRVLRGDGRVLFGFGGEPATFADRLDGRSESAIDSALMTQALLAAGFVEVEQVRSADGSTCVLGRTKS